MSLSQIIGYRTILLNTGTLGEGVMQDEDFDLFDDWLTSPDCDANAYRQVFLVSGDRAAEGLTHPGGVEIVGFGEAFLNHRLGAVLFCDAFNGLSDDPDCEPANDSPCVRMLPVDGGAFGTQLDIDAWGNGCPYQFGFNILQPTGTGIGNRSYSAEDGLKDAEYAQIVNEDLGAGANYRSAIRGVSWHHTTKRNADATDPLDFCPRDLPVIVEGLIGELGAALLWGHGVTAYDSLPLFTGAIDLGSCQGSWYPGVDVEEGPRTVGLNRLYQNQPNPFNPTTTIRFSLAQEGPVEILIYDVSGRLVRTLVDRSMDAGFHTVLWDGKDDRDRLVGSGIYWSQMRAGAFTSIKKMVVLK
jgi:hypothetical protein